MAKRIPSTKNSVWISWLVSYFSVLLIPILISGVVYFESASIIEKEITQGNQLMLKQVQQAIDSKRRDVERLSLQIAWNPRLQGLLYVRGAFQENHHYNINLLLQDFRIYQVANSYVDDFFIYLPGTQVVLGTQSIYDRRFFEENMQNSDRISFDKWEDLQSSHHIKEYMLMDVKDVSGNPMKNIAFVQSLPWEYPQNPVATLVILFNEARFLDSIKNIRLIDEGTLFIIDSSNTIMASTAPVEWEEDDLFEQLQDQDSMIYRDISGERHVLSYVQSEYGGWKYVFVLPSKTFMGRMRYIRQIIWVSIILCLLIGGIVAYAFSRKHYNPLYSIVQTLGKKAGITRNEGFNDYQFIEESISKTLDEKEAVQTLLQQQNFVLKSNLLMRLLKGRTEDNVELKDLLCSFDMHFPSDRFAVMLYYIEGFDALFPEDATESPWEQLKLVQFIICNVTEELFGKNHRAFVGDMDGTMMVSLVNLSESDTDPLEEITIICKETQEFLKEKFFIELTISISGVHNSISGIPEAYQEALDAMEYRMVLGRDRIIDYRDIQHPTASYDYPLDKEHQLINYVKAGDYDKAKVILNEVFSDNFNTKAISVQMAKCMLFDLVSTMIKAMNEICSTGRQEFLESLNPLERVLNANTVIEMKYHITEILKEICSYVKQNQKSQYAHLTDSITKYIHENYVDDSLSISVIAEQFQMTPAYLSKIFKEQTGEGMLEMLNGVRIQKAKDLLKVPANNIGQIAQMVGYYSSNAFIRSFKKYEGITPGKYREMIR